MTKRRFEPCRCGSSRLYIEEDTFDLDQHGIEYWVRCRDCKECGTLARSPRWATRYWNDERRKEREC